MQPARLPVSIRFFVAVSWILGWWLVIEGLALRLWGGPLRLGAPLLWVAVAQGYGVELGWPFLVAGFCLIGASFGLVLGRRWGFVTGLIVCALALGYAPGGPLLGAFGLLLLLLPTTRAHLHSASSQP